MIAYYYYTTTTLSSALSRHNMEMHGHVMLSETMLILHVFFHHQVFHEIQPLDAAATILYLSAL